MNTTTCAFTGHRPHKFPWKYNELDPGCVALKETLKEQIAKLAASGVTDFYSGMADGSDVWLSQIVLDFRKNTPALNLHCVLPCEGQADQWSKSARDRYDAILNRADSVAYVSRQYYDGCMLDRNRKLVESADLLLAVYNGERRGGTAATLRYAKKLGRELIIVHPVSLHKKAYLTTEVHFFCVYRYYSSTSSSKSTS